VPLLAATFILKEPFPLPLAGVTVSQEVALLDTFQALLANTFTVRLSAPEDGLHDPWDSDKDAACAPWVTVIERVTTPGIVTVTEAVRPPVPGFALAFILKEPLPVRFAGDIFDMVSHAELLVTVHWPLEVTFTWALLSRWVPRCQSARDSAKLAWWAAWVTLTVRVGAPDRVTVMVPDLVLVPVLVAAFIVKKPPPVRVDGVMFDMVSQDTLLLIFHVPWAVTDTTSAEAADVGDQEPVFSDRDAGVACWVTVTERVVAPGAVTVMVVVLGFTVGFGAVFILKEPLFVRFAGLMFDIVTQATFTLIVHCLLDVTFIVVLLAAAGDVQLLADSVRVATLKGVMSWDWL